MKRTSLIAFLMIAAVTGLVAEDAKLAFNWAFVKQAADGSAVPIDFKERVNIVPGDLFKIHIQPIQNAFVYLFLQEANGDLDLLFPASFDVFEGHAYQQTPFFIPEGDDWFTLDNAKGTERFTLIASTARLKQLEALVLAFQKTAANTQSTAAAKSAAQQAVLDEIARLRKEHSQLAVAAEKPVTIAGGTRGINATVQKMATRIEATGFYYKLFRLEH
ncbi:MAG: DUF4384 domain-containing protein [Spirochaetia bacterium]|jgi:hypothetical protein